MELQCLQWFGSHHHLPPLWLSSSSTRDFCTGFKNKTVSFLSGCRDNPGHVPQPERITREPPSRSPSILLALYLPAMRRIGVACRARCLLSDCPVPSTSGHALNASCNRRGKSIPERNITPNRWLVLRARSAELTPTQQQLSSPTFCKPQATTHTVAQRADLSTGLLGYGNTTALNSSLPRRRLNRGLQIKRPYSGCSRNL
jgi:hypothetical protein